MTVARREDTGTASLISSCRMHKAFVKERLEHGEEGLHHVFQMWTWVDGFYHESLK